VIGLWRGGEQQPPFPAEYNLRAFRNTCAPGRRPPSAGGFRVSRPDITRERRRRSFARAAKVGRDRSPDGHVRRGASVRTRDRNTFRYITNGARGSLTTTGYRGNGRRTTVFHSTYVNNCLGTPDGVGQPDSTQ